MESRIAPFLLVALFQVFAVMKAAHAEETEHLDVPTAPDSAPHVPTAPDSALHVPAAPDSALHVPTAPDSAPHVPTVPDSALHGPPAPDSALHVPTAPDSALHVPTAPDSALHVPATPDSTLHVLDSESYLDDLLRQAERLRLHEDPYWHTLLHYKKGLFGLRSLVDDPKFFASPEGKQKPAEELKATLRSFFSLPDSSQGKHPVCRFPARLEWLTEKLAIDRSRLPLPECDSFEAFYAAISPLSASLIFPTSHMNSPASMYGHTLITIQGENGSELLSYAVNYAAVTRESFGPFYIVKGLFGLYPGYFSILPYYMKLQQYSDVNDRDIWEYPLSLTPAELRRLLAHVYEMEDVYSDYYFFSENCSYDLLFLLDAARPSLRLTDEFGWWVIPLDTIRAIQRTGLTSEAVYRPSKSTKIMHLAQALPKEQRKAVVRVAFGEQEIDALVNGGTTREEKTRAVDLTSEYLQYLHAKGEIEKADYVPRFLQALQLRSTLGEGEAWLEEIPSPPEPALGHRSSRAMLGSGVRDREYYQELRIRPAYHDLLDASQGFKPGSEIIFLEGVVRYYPRIEEAQLERFDAIGITSIAPRNEFFRHTSWKVETGLIRRSLAQGGRDLVYRLDTGFGRSVENFLGMPYAMIESEIQVGGALDGNWSWGGGASLGTIKAVSDWWNLQLLGRAMFFRLGEQDDRFGLALGSGFRLSRNWNLSLETERSTEQDVSIWDSKVGLRFFY